MKKMNIIGLSKEKEMVLDTLNRCGCVELKKAGEIENTHTRLNVKRLASNNSKISKLSNAIDFLNAQKQERVKLANRGEVEFTPPKKPIFFCRQDVLYDDFISSAKREYEIFAIIDEIEKIGGKIADLKGETIALKNYTQSLKPYMSLDVPLDEINDTKNTRTVIGSVAETNSGIVDKLNKLELAHAQVINSSGSTLDLFVVYHKAVATEVSVMLNDNGFIKTNVECSELASEKVQANEARIAQIEQELVDLNGEAVRYLEVMDEIKLLFDYFSYKKEKIEQQGNFRRTEKEVAVAFEAWVPEVKCEFVQQAVLEKTKNIVIDFDDPKEGEMPPTMTTNGKVVRAFESVTNMYSAPSYYENDPNFSVMIFFFIFFGFMVSDAGYGLLLAIAGFFVYKRFKLENGMKNLALIIALGGLSTIVWGILFGGIFSISIEGTIFEKLCLFSPLDNPLAVLGLSLGLGVVQIMYGLGMKAAQLIKRGQWKDALMDIGSWYLLFIGIGVLALGLVPGFEFFGNAGLYLAGAGALCLILTQGRAKKGFFGKALGGVGSLYGLVNYVSDILSYSRLFGLGLATGVIGMVFNEIAMVFINLIPVAGYVVALVFILVGHTMNVGLAVLGAYVHDCRLQFIEFFGKFYEGGGHVFVPLGSKTKYIKVVSEAPAISKT